MAPGFDKVPISVVKDCLEHILPTLTDLINHSLSSSVFLLAWKKGEVVPHPKESDHEVANNNCPITLLPVLSKVAERIVVRQFNDKCVNNLVPSYISCIIIYMEKLHGSNWLR